MRELARWNGERDCWETAEVDLLSGLPVVFTETWPASATIRNNVLYALPMSEHHTEGSGFSFSQHDEKILPTPVAQPSGNSPDDHLRKKPGREVVTDLAIIVENGMLETGGRLLKTPTAQLAINGGSQHPDKRKAGGHGPTLADEVEHLLPTPMASDTQHPSDGDMRRKSPGLRAIDGLLPTPKAGDADFGMPRTSGRPPEKSTHLMTRLVHTLPDRLLPTPNTMEHLPARTGEARERQLRRGQGPDASRRQSMGNLREDIVEVEPVEWGPYEAAIRRWERVLGRDAPAPTELGPKGGRRLSAHFVEFMMGLPEGWVTDPALGLSRTQQLKMLGNGVVKNQAVAALQSMRAARSINEGETK